MDLTSIEAVERPEGDAAIAARMGCFGEGDAWLAGGTWLFSEPQPQLRRLIDLAAAGWPPISADAEGLFIAATCTIAELDRFEAPGTWQASHLIGKCCRAFLASFKIWNVATVGGNLCMSLPAGPMISLTTALDGSCEILSRSGSSRKVPAVDFVHGPLENALEPGEILRGVYIPAASLMRPAAFRRISLSPMGRTGALVTGTRAPDGGFDLTVTGATRRPVRVAFSYAPALTALRARIDVAIPPDLWHDDIHGRPEWRRHMVMQFAAEIVAELSEGAA
ncbi:MAG: FAD binding domain-containing protein [Rhodobacteraceae bacterium]|nr:FAD binding domain-containing protein [Paracoccaceae bacterium]